MHTLKQEYQKNKEHKEKVVEEAAYSWVNDNIIIINEKINRTIVNRLTRSITRFDEKFGPFREKVPAVQDIIDKAEMGLQLVLTGKTSDSRAIDMLQHLSMVYNMLANFFSSDLPVLLRTPIFFSAKEEPEKRLDMITGPKYDPTIAVAAFETALRPSKEELKLFSKVYKNIPMPNLQPTEIAKQLLGLSFNDLVELTGIEKVPMVGVTSPSSSKEEKETTELPMEEPIEEEKKSDELEEQAAPGEEPSEAGWTESLTKLLGELQKLQPAISQFPEDIKSNFNNFFKQARGALLSRDVRKIKPAVQQAQLTLGTFKTLGDISKQIQPLLSDNELDANEEKQLSGYLTGAFRGGLFQRIASAASRLFGGAMPPPQGLDPNTIVTSLVNSLKKGAEEAQKEKQQATPPETTPTTVATESINDDEAKINKLFEQLNVDQIRKLFTTLDTVTKAMDPKAMGAPTPETKTTERTTQTATGGAATGTPTTPTTGTGVTTPTTGGAPERPTSAAGKEVGRGEGFVELPRTASVEQLKAVGTQTGVKPDMLKHLASQRGIRIMVDPDFFKVR